MKAISAVIAIVLILMITVALAAVGYLWTTGMFEGLASSTGQQTELFVQKGQADSEIDSFSEDMIYIRNTGNIDLTSVAFYTNEGIVTEINLIEKGEIVGIPVTFDEIITEFSITDFGLGIKVNASGEIDSYDVPTNALTLDFPYKSKDDNLVSYFRLEDLSDETGKHSDGAIGGDARYVSSGFYDGCYEFLGTDDYVTFGDYDDYSFGDGTNDQPFSISAWVYSHFIGSYRYQAIVAKYYTGLYQSTTAKEFIFGTNMNDYLQVSLHENIVNTNKYVVRTSANKLQVNAWYMVTMTYDGRGGADAGEGIRIYVNGIDDTGSASGTGTYDAMVNTASPISLGAIETDVSPTRDISGFLDEVKIYSRELTSDEVSILYNNRKKYIDTTWGGTHAYYTTEILDVTNGYELTNTTIGFSNVNENYYIDKVEWYSNGELKAMNDNDIVSGTEVFYSDIDGMDYGSLSSIDDDFQIFIYLNGDGSSTPIIENIYGGYSGEIIKLNIGDEIKISSKESSPKTITITEIKEDGTIKYK